MQGARGLTQAFKDRVVGGRNEWIFGRTVRANN